jgi:hypothetical protein
MSRPSPTTPDSDVQALTSLHLHARRRLNEIHEDAEALQAAGRVFEARILLQQGDAIEHGLRVVESELRSASEGRPTPV